MKIRDKRLFVCESSSLPDKQYLIREMRYKGEAHTTIVFRLHGKVFAYLNQCVHMPRPLNCNRNTVFDDRQEHLRCSMHGILYKPESGESISTMCEGERLQALRLVESDGKIYFNDKHVSLA